MASFIGKIYLTTNNINGKIYVGQTTGNSAVYLGSGVALNKAFVKYGKENFSRIILRDNISNGKELDFWEDFYVNLLDSQNKKFGYNCRPGGKNGGWKHTQKALNKISKRSQKDDNKIRIREIQKISRVKALGIPRTKEIKLRCMETKFGRYRQIEIYSKDGSLFDVCDFSPEAEKLTGVKRAAISNNLCGLSKFAGDFIFKYKNI